MARRAGGIVGDLPAADRHRRRRLRHGSVLASRADWITGQVISVSGGRGDNVPTSKVEADAVRWLDDRDPELRATLDRFVEIPSISVTDPAHALDIARAANSRPAPADDRLRRGRDPPDLNHPILTAAWSGAGDAPTILVYTAITTCSRPIRSTNGPRRPSQADRAGRAALRPWPLRRQGTADGRPLRHGGPARDRPTAGQRPPADRGIRRNWAAPGSRTSSSPIPISSAPTALRRRNCCSGRSAEHHRRRGRGMRPPAWCGRAKDLRFAGATAAATLNATRGCSSGS